MVTVSKIISLLFIFILFSFAFGYPIEIKEESRQAAAAQALLGSLGTALVPVVGNLLVPVLANLAGGLSSALSVGLQTTQQAALLQRPILNRPLLQSPLLNRPPTLISRPIEDGSLDAYLVDVPGSKPMMMLSSQGGQDPMQILQNLIQTLQTSNSQSNPS